MKTPNTEADQEGEGSVRLDAPSPLSLSLFDTNILATTRYHVILPNVKYVKSTCLKIVLGVFRPKCNEKYLCFLDQSLDSSPLDKKFLDPSLDLRNAGLCLGKKAFSRPDTERLDVNTKLI